MASPHRSEARRVVVIHEDDVGMTHGANAAFAGLSRLGTCSSGSVMAPCPGSRKRSPWPEPTSAWISASISH